jgi:hypothetical protein
VKSFFKSSVSIGLMLLVFCTQVAIPVIQNIGDKSLSASSVYNIYQVYEEEVFHNTDYIIADQGDVFTSRSEGGNTLFYTLSPFSLEAFHNLIVKINWGLSTLVNIQFTLADKIFPFAYFW